MAKGSLIRLWQWVKDQIVCEVPEDLVLCEYDCRKKQCTVGEWETSGVPRLKTKLGAGGDSGRTFCL